MNNEKINMFLYQPPQEIVSAVNDVKRTKMKGHSNKGVPTDSEEKENIIKN